MDQPLPFSFELDTILDLSHMVEFDDMLYDPIAFVNSEGARKQLNVANQNTSTTRVVTPIFGKGNEFSSPLIDSLFNNILNHVREKTGLDVWQNISPILVNTPYIRLVADKRTFEMDYTILFTVSTAKAPIVTIEQYEPKKPSIGKRFLEETKIVPNSVQKPWEEREWSRIGGILMPPPLKTYSVNTEAAAEYNDTMVMSIKFKRDRAGYTVIDQDRSVLLVYGPSSNYRKIGLQLCYVDPEFQEIIGSAQSFKEGVNALLPDCKLDPRITVDNHESLMLVKNTFQKYYEPDPLNREMYGPYQFHTCLISGDAQIENQLWDLPFKNRVRAATYDIQKLGSTALFKLFIENIKHLNKQSNNLATVKNLALICNKCWLSKLYEDFARVLMTTSKHLNINSIKEIFPERYLYDVFYDCLSSMASSAEMGHTRKRSKKQLKSMATTRIALGYANIVDLVSTSIFQTFSEQRKLSILKSFYHGDSKITMTIDGFAADVVRMLGIVENHRHAQKGLAELKKRDVRTLHSLHEELTYVIEILNTIPVDIKNNHQWDFILGKEEIPDTNLVIRIPESNIDIKTWGTRQRHCIGSYADDVLNQTRVVIGIWDKSKNDWFGHMSFQPVLKSGAQPDDRGRFANFEFHRTTFSVHQFYGMSNSALPEPHRQQVIDYLSSLLNDWLIDHYKFPNKVEEAIESTDHVSLMRSEHEYYASGEDGEIVFLPEKGKLKFNDFHGCVMSLRTIDPQKTQKGFNLNSQSYVNTRNSRLRYVDPVVQGIEGALHEAERIARRNG